MNKICIFFAATAKVYAPMDSLCSIIREVLPGHEILAIGRKELFENHHSQFDGFIEIPDLLIRLFERFAKKGPQLLARTFLYSVVQFWVSLKVLSCRCKVFYVINAEALLPMVFAKIAGSHIVLRLGGSSYQVYKKVGGNILGIILGAWEKLLIFAADKVVYAGPPKVISKKFYSTIDILPSKEFFEVFHLRSNAADRMKYVGYLGRLSPEKGVDILIQTAKILIARSEDINILIAGDGPLRPIVEKELRVGINGGRVKLLGWLPHDEVPEFLSTIRLLLLPSYTEGLPSAVIESLACGTPVIASSVGEIPKILQHGKTGLLLNKLNPEKIASLIMDLINDDSRIRKMSDDSFSFAKMSLNKKDFIKVWEKIFKFGYSET